MREIKCQDCGATNLEWKKSKAGKWYLANIHYGPRGSRYNTPHFKNCDKSLKARRDLEAADRQWRADAWMFMDAEERHYARMEREDY